MFFFCCFIYFLFIFFFFICIHIPFKKKNRTAKKQYKYLKFFSQASAVLQQLTDLKGERAKKFGDTSN